MANLLKKRGLAPSIGYRNPLKFKDEFVLEAGGYQKALVAFREALDNPDLFNIGLVIDANEAGAEARWQSVRNILLDKLPSEIVDRKTVKSNGIILEEENLPTIGVWIIPDNQNPGYLEHFLAGMVADNDDLWKYAEETIQELGTEGLRRFSSTKTQKALLHTWLSWQPEPGKPFGLAIEMGYLDAKSASVDAFVEWFQKTFELGGE